MALKADPARRCCLGACALALLAAGGAPALANEHLCGAEEKVLFACNEGPRLVSVCASADLAKTAGYVQLRYGVPGSGEIITWPEASYPRRHVSKGNVLYQGRIGIYFRFQMERTGFVVFNVRDVASGLVISRGAKILQKRLCQQTTVVDWAEAPVPVADAYAVTGIGSR